MTQAILDYYQRHFDSLKESLNPEQPRTLRPLLNLTYGNGSLTAQLNPDHPRNEMAHLNPGRTFTDFTWTLLGTRMTFTATDLQGWGGALQVAMIYIQLGMPIYYESAIFEDEPGKPASGQLLEWVAHRCDHLWPDTY